MAAKPIVFVGPISYLLYMWHWPIKVMLRYYSIEPIDPALTAGAVIAMFTVAIVSWRFGEAPFRRKQMSRRVLAFVVPASLV